MRLARKLILAMVLGMAVVMAANAYYRVHRELRSFEEDMVHDHQVLAFVLGAAMADVWAAEGREAAMALVSRVHHPQVDVQWFDRDPGIGRVATSDVHYTDQPIDVHGKRMGYLQISESNAYSKAYVRKTVVRTAVLALLLMGLASALAYVLGVGLVGKPMARLVQKARRIGAGDLSGPLTIRQRDEIGELAAEMNAMCERLHEAREALVAESEARVRAVEQVRHADRLATVGKLASGIAHELGTPMGVALLRANQIAGSQAPHEVRDAGRIISEQVDRMTTIVRQLLDFARGRAALAPGAGQRQAADLHGIAQRTIAMLQPMADKRGITISLCHDEPAPRPAADSEQIQQVMVNLVVNAIHAFDRPGQIRISIEHTAATPPADVSGPIGGASFACIRVEDQGVGIAPEILPRIFEPFFTTKDVGEGTGLGLSVAYGIVREHGGWIDVQSERGKGSRFSAFLPLESPKLVARA